MEKMLPKVNPTKTKVWKKLKEHYRVMKTRHMVDLFRQDPEKHREQCLSCSGFVNG